MAYEAIINEYRDACLIDSENVGLGSEWNQFPNVAETMMTYYHIYGHDFDFCFVNYDIDGNGIPELLIGEQHDADNINIVDAYAFDGNSAVKIVDSDTLGDRLI